jgi:predicted RNase H-like nuclease
MKLFAATLAALAMSVLPSVARAIEEPAYKVVQMLDGAEVREYAPTIVAEVSVPGPADEAANQGFRLLAAYIFGANRGERKIAMTAPVTQAVEPAKIAMTAPVTQSAEAGGHVIQFTMPSAYTMETLPLPTDPRVRLREVPSTRQAVIRYSGFWTEANNREQLARLQKALQTAGLKPAGEPVYARYDPPWTPWFMRRHEIWLRLP